MEAYVAGALAVDALPSGVAVVGACQLAAVLPLVARVADAHAVETAASIVAVVEASELGAVFSRVAGAAHALSVHAGPTAVAVVGTGALSAVFPGETFVAVAGSVDAAATVVTIVGANELGAVESGPRLFAPALSIHAAPMAQAVVQAVGLRAVVTAESFGTDAPSTLTLAVLSTVHWANFQSAILSGEALEANTLPVYAPTLVLAAIGAFRLAAVSSLPASLTNTTARLRTEVATAVAVRLGPHRT